MTVEIEAGAATLPDTGATERRRSQRHRVLKGATLTFNGGYGSFEGTVRDMSEGGARLRFGDALGAPGQFSMRVSGDERSFAAAVRWREGTDIGVVLLAPASLPGKA